MKKIVMLVSALSLGLMACPNTDFLRIEGLELNPAQTLQPCEKLLIRVTASAGGRPLDYKYSITPQLGSFTIDASSATYQPRQSTTTDQNLSLQVTVSSNGSEVSQTRSILLKADSSVRDCSKASMNGQVFTDYQSTLANDQSTPSQTQFRAGEAVVKINPKADRQHVKQLGYKALVFARQTNETVGLLRFDGIQTPDIVSAQDAAGKDTLAWIAQLKRRPDVVYAEPNYIYRASAYTPTDPLYPRQAWHYQSIQLSNAWETTRGQSYIVVAVIDSGILYRQNDISRQHPDFQCTVSPGDLPKIAPGYDFFANDNDPFDEGPAQFTGFHGTHVAGTVGACENNGVGGTGVAANVRIQPIRALGPAGGTLEDITRAIRWAAGARVSGVPDNATPARVINMSFGGIGAPSAAFQEAIDEARARGAVLVVAAGNDSIDYSKVQPANQFGVIPVGAVGPAAQGDLHLASYSNYGSGLILAPGGDQRSRNLRTDGVLSTLGCGADPDAASSLPMGQSPPCTGTEFGYSFYQGTSMAAPHISGLVALMLSSRTDLTGSNTWAKVAAYLQRSASTSGIGDCEKGCGAGLVQAAGAVSRAANGEALGGYLTLDTSQNDFGTSKTSLTLRFRNIGDAVASARLEPQSPLLTVSPSTISLNPNAVVDVTMTLNRAATGAGAFISYLRVLENTERQFQIPLYYRHGSASNDIGEIGLRVYLGFVLLKNLKLSYPYTFDLKDYGAGGYTIVAYHGKQNANTTIRVDQIGETYVNIKAGERRDGVQIVLEAADRDICSDDGKVCP
jgi:subtilisin family serine protease